jgi:hypothetical protein
MPLLPPSEACNSMKKVKKSNFFLFTFTEMNVVAQVGKATHVRAAGVVNLISIRANRGQTKKNEGHFLAYKLIFLFSQ